MALLNDFHVKFTKSITLRNQLKPVGKTLENIRKNQIIENDELRNENYKKAKLIIDQFHRNFIDNALATSEINWEYLADTMLHHDELDDDKEKHADKLKKVQEQFRKYIADLFKKYQFKSKEKCNDIGRKKKQLSFQDIFKAALFEDLLPATLTNEEDKKIIEGFCKFTTYFKGYNENRENMYSSEEQSTAIAYRIINDNFPKFLSNLAIYKTWKDVCPKCINEVTSALRSANLISASDSFDDLFSLNSFNRFLGQKGIDLYNKLIGGLPAVPGQAKIIGLNERINLACQQDKSLFETLKKKRSLKMMPLYKQILSDRENNFVIDEFKSDEETIEAVKSFYKTVLCDEGAERIIAKLLHSLSDYNCAEIYVSGKFINSLSKDLYGGENWSLLRDAICRQKGEDKNFKKTLKHNDSSDTVDKIIAKESYSLAFLANSSGKDLIKDIDNCLLQKEQALINTNDGEWPKELKSETEKDRLKRPLDALLNLFRFMEYFATSDYEKDLNFYADYTSAINEFSSILKLYNKVRNYATKKPYSLEKFKLNFNNPQLADGWSETKENDCLSVILKKENLYYLGIFNKKDKPDFKQGITEDSSDSYQKMKYIQFKDISKMLPKCTFTDDVKTHFQNDSSDYVLFNKKTFVRPLVITEELFRLYTETESNLKKFQKAYQNINKDAYRKALTKWINFGKDFLASYRTTSVFDFSTLKVSEDYDELTQFYNDVDNITYKLDWINVKSEFVDHLVEAGKLYLFQIYNKDFAPGSTGSKNLHTLYLESIFDKLNNDTGVIKLNGYAELFYRHRSIDDKNMVVHKKHSVLVNRTYLDKQTNKVLQIPADCYQEIFRCKNGLCAETDISPEAQHYLSLAKVKVASHNIIKDRRFTEDKFFFHCPISINYKAGAPTQFNRNVLNFLKNNTDINIIGIDRGERNLIYATVINQKGEILECKSFNSVSHNSSDNNRKNYDVDYHEKLSLKEKERDQARRSWNTVSKIKTLKEGYLSAVIHELTLLMIKYNAIIVLENLNMGFKRVRGGIAEKSVYQKFEKMLIDKLNYLVFKSKNKTEAGGILNGYQLTNQFTSFKDIVAQTGFLFYVPAAFTSKIDPATGFVNVINLSKIKNAKEQKNFFSLFDEISFDICKKMFKFTLDYSKIKVTQNIARNKWDIFSVGTRIVRYKNKAGYFEENRNYKPTEELSNLFNEYNVDWQSGRNLLPDLVCNERLNSSFWNKLFFIFKNVLQMRNSAAGTMEDYIQSPVMDKNGRFFNSSLAEGTPYELLKDADANGAYHIALKGLLILRRNNDANSDAELKKVCAITSKDWFRFVQVDIKDK